jgi:lipoate-protein ligase A
MLYIPNDSMDPYYNFALEYYLITESALADDIFLFWRTDPTLMIGRNQITAEEINGAYAREKGINVVRRITGGGTIYTDPGGWQFSYIIKGRPQAEVDFRTYAQPIIDALKVLGVEAYFNNRNDLLIGDRKFSGNAQFSTERLTLHHGSILYDTDLGELVRSITVAEEKIISKGIKSVRQRVTNVSEHMPRKMDPLEFRDAMLQTLLKGTTEHALEPHGLRRVEEIAEAKFRSWDWNYGASPQFSITKSERFAGGKVEVGLNVGQGRVSACRISGDFFSRGDVSDLSNALIGCVYEETAIRQRLEEAGADRYFHMIALDELMRCMI